MNAAPLTDSTHDLHAGLQLLLILFVLLAAATVAVVPANGLGARGALRAQVTSWWRLMPVVFLAWATQPFGGEMLVAIVALLVLRELQPHLRDTLGARLALAAVIVVELAAMALGHAAWGAGLLVAALCIDGILMAARPGARRDLLVIGIAAVQGVGLLCLVIAPGPEAALPLHADWFLYLCVVTAINDIGQYIAGTSIGRHRLASRISPNKTWQGAIGGALVSVPVSVGVGRLLGLSNDTAALAALGLLLSVAGVCGDLLFSAGKRALGIKDYGTLIPGHGGILDRVDSLVLTAPALLVALAWR